jgi:HprK-related kinase A
VTTVGELPAAELLARSRRAGFGYEVGPFAVRLRTALPDVARVFAFLYQAFPLLDADSVVDVEVEVRSKFGLRGWISILADGETQYDWLRRRLAVPLVEWTMNVCVFQRPHQYFMLHAAVVERSGRAAVLPGRAGSGKSTLTAALAHRGWRLLSDEVAPIRPSDREVVPVPRPVSLKDESIDVIARFAPDAVIGPRTPGTSKGTVAHVLPPADSVRRAGETAEIAWILFPEYVRGERAAIHPVPKARALLRAAERARSAGLRNAGGRHRSLPVLRSTLR